MKWIDLAITGVTPGSTGSVNAILNDINTGTSDNNRIGKRVVIRKIDIHFEAYSNQAHSESFNPETFCCMLVLDKQCNGAYPTLTDVVQSATQQALAFNNLDNSMRFVTLKKWMIKPAAYPVYDGVNIEKLAQVNLWSYSKRCRIPVEYSGTVGGIAERRSNNLFLLSYGNDAAGTTYERINYNVRIRFTDS